MSWKSPRQKRINISELCLERERERTLQRRKKGGKLNNSRVSTNMVKSRDLGEGDIIFFFLFSQYNDEKE